MEGPIGRWSRHWTFLVPHRLFLEPTKAKNDQATSVTEGLQKKKKIFSPQNCLSRLYKRVLNMDHWKMENIVFPEEKNVTLMVLMVPNVTDKTTEMFSPEMFSVA